MGGDGAAGGDVVGGEGLEAAETLVMEVLGYCAEPEGFEDHIADPELECAVGLAAVQSFFGALQTLYVGEAREMDAVPDSCERDRRYE